MGLREALGRLVEKVAYTELTPSAVREAGYDVLLELVENDVAYDVAEALIESLAEELSREKVGRFSDKRRVVRDALRRLLLKLFESAGELDMDAAVKKVVEKKKPCIIVLLGPNGHGKTTTAAKLAYRYSRLGMKPLLVGADTFRAGAIEQLRQWGERIGVEVHEGKYGADPAAVAYDAIEKARKNGHDVVIVDTAGRMHTNVNLVDEMKKIVRVVSPHFRVYVGDALVGSDAVEQAGVFSREVGVDAVILTKMDADVKGGAAVSIVYVAKRPIVYVGVGQNPGDLKKFNYREFINTILPE